MPSLAARLVTAIDPPPFVDNVLPPGHVAHVEFVDPPVTARDVTVHILESVQLFKGRHPHKELGRFLGHFSGGQLIVDEIVAAPLNASRPQRVLIVAGEGAGRATFSGSTPRPRDVAQHTLAVEVEAPGFVTFTGAHRLHIGNPGAAIVFTEDRSDGAGLRGYATRIAKSINGQKLSRSGTVVAGPWSFKNSASVVHQIKAFHEKSGVLAAEIHVVGHTNNGLDFDSPRESEVLAKHAVEDVKIVWHGCYACNFFNSQRQAAFFKNIPAGTVYGHRDIQVQAGMPWGFVRIRKEGEVDIARIIPEVVPRSYVVVWAANEPEKHLRKTLKAEEAEADVKLIVRAELARRRLR